jgi:hypothetical protein
LECGWGDIEKFEIFLEWKLKILAEKGVVVGTVLRDEKMEAMAKRN